MTIEKRLSKRVELKMSAIMRRRGKDIGNARIRNLNLDGMMIDTEGRQLPRGAMLNLAFEFGGKVWELPALVIHSRGDLHGVMFSVSQRELYEMAVRWEQASASSGKSAGYVGLQGKSCACPG